MTAYLSYVSRRLADAPVFAREFCPLAASISGTWRVLSLTLSSNEGNQWRANRQSTLSTPESVQGNAGLTGRVTAGPVDVYTSATAPTIENCVVSRDQALVTVLSRPKREEPVEQISGPRRFIAKILKDNVTMLASVVAWGVLSSIIPIIVGLIGISGILLHDPVRQRIVISDLSRSLQSVLTPAELRDLVRLAVQHSGLLGIFGVLGILWGASNIGGAISTVFQPIFLVRGRPLLKEKLLDIGMIFVFTSLMLVIIAATTAGAIVSRSLTQFPLTGATTFIVGTIVSALAAFLLFFVIYAVFPNIQPRFRVGHVWRGALIAALLFQILSYMWPLYALFFHPKRFGAVLAPIAILAVWIYFFALILVIGGEVVAFGALDEASSAGEPIGPAPDGTVPQRVLLPGDRA